MTAAPNLTAAREYLHRLDPEAALFTFQTFADDGKDRKLARIVHADPGNGALDELAALNARGAGIFVTVNATDGAGRQKDNVVRVRAVFLDLDGAPLEPVLTAALEPHFVCESSPGRFHVYYLTDDCPREDFERVQRALARRFAGDPSVHDLPRVLRVPGFLHRKGEPFQSRILEGIGFNGPPYALAEIVGALSLDLTGAEPARRQAEPGVDGKFAAGERNGHLFRMGRSMAKKGLSRDAVLAALQAENAARCDPPLPEERVRYNADRAFAAKDELDYENAARRRDVEQMPGAPATGSQERSEVDELLRSKDGAIKPCEHNGRVIVRDAAQYAGLHFDEFLSRQRIDGRDWIDADDLTTLLWLQSAHRVPGFTLGQARNAARAVAYARRRDSLKDFITALPAWDGVARIEHAFADAWGAPDDALTRAAARNFFVALIARAVVPGAKVDTLWTFEGPQGVGKSLALHELGGDFHAEITAAIGTTDFMRELRGIWLAELSELDSLRGKEASTVKRLLSAPADRFVQKYALHAESYPRRAVAVATTNEATYWQDPTGARRLVPIICSEIRLDLIRSNRLQWFAEARRLYAEGSTWWQFPSSMADAQESRQQVDPWEDALRGMIAHGRRAGSFDGQGVTVWPAEPITTAEILRDWLRLEPHQQGPISGTRLGRVMRRLGFEPTRIGHERARGWQLADTQTDAGAGVSSEVSA